MNLGLDWQVASGWFRRPKLTFDRRDGLLFVNDGRQEFAIVRDDAAERYRHGIDYRCRWLALRYRIGIEISIRPGDLVVNCGANVGELPLALSAMGARIIAVEPDPTTLRCLYANVAGKAGITVAPVGLWERDGPLEFYQKPDTSDTSAINRLGEPVTIPARRLDSMITEPIRLFVGDAEGGEPEVLRGAEGILERIDYVSLDCSPERHGAATHDACRELLAGRFVVREFGDRLMGINRRLV